MGCKTGEFATMDTLPQPTTPSSLPAPAVGAIDYGNHVIEALLKMSSDTDDDEEDTLDSLLPSFPKVGGSLYPGQFSARPQQISNNHEFPAGPLSSYHHPVYAGPDSPISGQYWASPQKNFSSPLEKHYLSPHWQKLGTAYSKDDSVLQQNSSFEYGSEKRAYSNDEHITPITPRLEKKPTYLNLSCMGKYELQFSPPLNNQVGAKHQSASSVSSLTDSYPAFTGDTSDCPYGHNYNKPRGLTKFEYHSSYIKQCQIERTARTKKVWEKSSKQRQILSRKRKLMKHRKAEGNNELTSPNLSNPDQNKRRLSSASKPHRKKRLIHSKGHSRKEHWSAHKQNLENSDILNKAIGCLGQVESNVEEISGHLAARPKRNCLDSRLSVNQSDTSYPASSRTWSTPESVSAELLSSNYSIFKSHVDQSQFKSSPLINASNSSVEQVPELLLSSSSLNLSSVGDSSSPTESLLEGHSDKCNQGFALKGDEVLSSVSSSSPKKKSCNKNIPPTCIRVDPTLSDSSVSLSTSLGERPDCLGQSCSSNTDSESEDVQNSDSGDTSPKHIANILSSTRNSQDSSTPEKKGPVIISPLSNEKDLPKETEEEKQPSPHDSIPPNESFLCPLPPKTRMKKINSVDKNTDKICTQLFPVESQRSHPGTVSTSSSSSSSHQKLHSAAPKQLGHDLPSSASKPMSSLKGKKDSHQVIPEPSCKTHSALLPKYGSIYFTPVSLSSTATIPTSLPFSNVCSNISSEDQASKKSPTRHKTHRRSHAKRTDKTSPESAARRRRTHVEHRKSESGFNNKENKDTGKSERPNECMGLAAAKVPRGSSKPTTYVVSKDSGLGACRSSDPSPFWATPYVGMSDTPEELVTHSGQLVTEDAIPAHPTKHCPSKDGFHLRDKKAVIKNFWNFHKKFIRKDRKTKGDSEFKTLAHF